MTGIQCVGCGNQVSTQLIACPDCKTPIGMVGGTPGPKRAPGQSDGKSPLSKKREGVGIGKLSDSEGDDGEKSEKADTTEGTSYPIFLVAGLAIGIALGGAPIGGTIGATIGFVVGGGIGGALQSIVTSRRDGGR